MMMGKHDADDSWNPSIESEDSERPWFRDAGRHADNDLDKPPRSRWRLALLWAMISLAVVIMLIVVGNMVGSARDVVGTGSDEPEPAVTVTETVTETETAEVPGPDKTSVVTVPGPRVVVTKTVKPTPSATPSPVPGPTVTVKVTVPGPVITRTVRTPAPAETETVIKCYTIAMIQIPCPDE